MSRAGAVQSAPGLSSLPTQLDLYLLTASSWARALIIGRMLNLGALRAQRAGADVSTLPSPSLPPPPHPTPKSCALNCLLQCFSFWLIILRAPCNASYRTGWRALSPSLVGVAD